MTPRRLSGFALAAILSPLNSTMIAVALPAIGSSFGADASTLTLWLVSAYLLVSILAQSPAGKLADTFGYSPVLTTGRIVFVLGALAGAFAPNVALLAVARIAMGIGGALHIPPVLAELRRQVAPERRGRLFGFFGALMGTAAAIGPIVGDFLIRSFGWHSVFLINLPILALSLILEPPRKAVRAHGNAVTFDIRGSILFAVAMTMLVAGMQAKSMTGWAISAAGVALLALFVVVERRTREPLLDPALFTIRSFAAGSTIVALQNFTMYAVLFLVPFIVGGGGDEPIGLLLLAMTGAMVVGSPIAGRISDSIGARITSIGGAIIATAGATLLLFAEGATTPLMIALAMLGGGIAFSTTPSQTAALSAVSKEIAGVAAGALSTMRYIGGVVGSAVVAVVIGPGREAASLMWLFPTAMLISAGVAFLLPREAHRD